MRASSIIRLCFAGTGALGSLLLGTSFDSMRDNICLFLTTTLIETCPDWINTEQIPRVFFWLFVALFLISVLSFPVGFIWKKYRAVGLDGTVAVGGPLARVGKLAGGQQHEDTDARNVTLRDACFYCAYGDWKHEDWGGQNVGSPEGMEKLLKAQTDLEQAACDGKLTIWGRRSSSTRFIKIPAEYWADHGVDTAFMMYENPNDWRTECRTGSSFDPIYVEVMTNRSQVIELCRKENT